VRAIAPFPEAFVAVDLSERDAELARRLRGRLVVEIAELRGLHTREKEAIKSWMSETADTWTPKYKEFAVTAPRRFVCVGTTNDDQFLADDTGNRRWLPLRVGVGGPVDRAAIERDRVQLWAEAIAVWRAGGVQWRDAEDEAPAQHAQYEMTDEAWESAIEGWLGSPKRGPEDMSLQDANGHEGGATWGVSGFTMRELLTGALGFQDKNIAAHHERRAASVVRRLGFAVQRRRLDDGTRPRVWARKTG